MYKVVYVLTDDGTLYYYNELMKSITSLKMYMPERCIEVVVDSETLDILKKEETEIIDLGILHEVSVPSGYTVVEKSRFIKVTLREHIKGDYLFIDTDTIVCKAFPEVLSNASIGMVLELHDFRSVVNDPDTDKRDNKCGLDLGGYEYYFNSGVVWSKDDDDAHKFYKEWHQLWEQTRKTGYHIDQPSLNSIVPKWIDKIEVLDGCWNVQIARMLFAPINYLDDAYIIHYMNYTWSPYVFCRPEIRQLDYRDERVLELLKKPKQFSRCRIVALDENNNYCDKRLAEFEEIDKTFTFRIFKRLYRRKKVFRLIEACSKCIGSLKAKLNSLSGISDRGR